MIDLKASLLMLFSSTSLIGCLPSIYSNEDAFLPELEQKDLREFKKELAIGKQIAGRIIQHYGMYEDSELTDYINLVGFRIAKFVDTPFRSYRFGILDSEDIFSMSAPGGYVFLSLGSLKVMRSEAELSILLSHEIAHVEKKHLIKAIKSYFSRIKQRSSDLDPLLEKRQRQVTLLSNKVSQSVDSYFAEKEVTERGLLDAAKYGLSLLIEKQWNPKFEYEADAYGLQIHTRAKYDPDAFVDLLTRLQNTKFYPLTKLLRAKDPTFAKRIENYEVLNETFFLKRIVGAKVQKRFQEKIASIR